MERDDEEERPARNGDQAPRQGVEHCSLPWWRGAADLYARSSRTISPILVRHEQGAVHAAEGYARSSGKVGAVLVTSGPGATNAVTGLTDALMDSIPIVVITGQVPTHLIGNDAFQECDTVGITRPCTKHNYLVKNSPIFRRDHKHSTGGERPAGPVVVESRKNPVAKGLHARNIQHRPIRRSSAKSKDKARSS